MVFAVCAMLATAAQVMCADQPDSEDAKPVGRWQDASLDDYRKHLMALKALTEACAKARNVQSCDPTLVGTDDRIPLSSEANAERRMVRYGWLRILFSHAEEPDKAQEAPGAHKEAAGAAARTAQPTTSELLDDAQDRLDDDLEQAAQFPGAPP